MPAKQFNSTLILSRCLNRPCVQWLHHLKPCQWSFSAFLKPFPMNLISDERAHTGLLSYRIICGSSLPHLYTLFISTACNFAVLQISHPWFCYCNVDPPPSLPFFKKNQFKVITAPQPAAVSSCVLLAFLDRDWQMWHRKELPQCWIFAVAVLLGPRYVERKFTPPPKKQTKKKKQDSLDIVQTVFLFSLEFVW